jgi:tetratricopeptide (TPR) repeat protein
MQLPQAPVGLPEDKPVKAWRWAVVLPTYEPYPADKNPMFLEKRVYQGSSGRVYPLPFTDRIETEARDREWAAIHLENEYIRVMILPEIGGRIHVGFDKTNGYDFFYRQNVIKPALVGLAGSWISGGVEFNWPQHHRPATFLPVDTEIEEHADGSVTVWCSDHDPMNRLKGMHGVCLHPGKARIELKVRLYNRTAFVQTFLWWANVATRVHEQYQSFFPPDVFYVADHARRAMSRYPLCEGLYYGIDYGRRAVGGIPERERPSEFVPEGHHAPNDLRWYSNIPVPTSYMAMGSREDFFGGYDYAKQAGLIHVANHHIAPGKKQWTWGNHEFGYAWDRNLTDADGPYIELMAGVFTDNQPDFSWLQPYETRTWSQFWYPIQKIGAAKQANIEAALNLERNGNDVRVGVCVTEPFTGARMEVASNGRTVFQERVDLAPGKPFEKLLLQVAGEASARVVASDGREIVAYAVREQALDAVVPDAATEPPPPEEIDSIDELYITGLHLEQYRHATQYPEPYWDEALRRDPMDSRCNSALGLLKLRRGELAAAEQHFQTAIERLTRRNANPANSDAHYYLGVTLAYRGRVEEAYAAYYKAVWNFGWQGAAYYQLAELDVKGGAVEKALEHLELSLAADARNLKARNLKTTLLRRGGRFEQARALAEEGVRMDPLDNWARHEVGLLTGAPHILPDDAQLYLDLAFDYAAAGLLRDAAEVLEGVRDRSASAYPMVQYVLGSIAERMGESEKARKYRAAAAVASSDYCFPSRVEEMLVLEEVLQANPVDAKAHYYLGNLLYDKKRYREAISAWEASVEQDGSFSIPWRNLGIAYFNVLQDPVRALGAYEKAFACNRSDARLLYELDQLRKRTGHAAAERFAALEKYLELVEKRDDLMVEFVTLCNQLGAPERALYLLMGRRFSPWEGGEGLVSGQYAWSHLLLGRARLQAGDPHEALAHFEAARTYPQNLGEGKHLLTPEMHLDYYSGVALEQAGRDNDARERWKAAVETTVPLSRMRYFQALSLAALGQKSDAQAALHEMRAQALEQMRGEVKIDYFATSLPNFLLFEDDLGKRNQIDCLFLMALADLGLGRSEEAAAGFKKVLSLDRNHLAAQEELRELEQRLAVLR